MKWTAAFTLVAYLAFVSAQNTTVQPQTSTGSSTQTEHPATSASTPPSSSTSTTPVPSPLSTTTAKPSSTTPAPVPPAPKEPSVNTYNVTNPVTNHTCIMVTAAIQLEYNYTTIDNKSMVGKLPLDKETVVDPTLSSCGTGVGINQTQTLALRFHNNYTLTLVFVKNSTVYLGDVNSLFSLDPSNFPNASQQYMNVTVRNNTLVMYSVPEDRSYHCSVDQPVYLGSGLTLDMVSVQLQAFINATKQQPNQFGAAVECAAGDISNIVPIAVGAALAALVIIVLIAYLIGRSKSRQKGYQSV